MTRTVAIFAFAVACLATSVASGASGVQLVPQLSSAEGLRVSISPDRKWAVTAHDVRLSIWDLERGILLRTLGSRAQPLGWPLAISPTGPKVVLNRAPLWIYDFETGKHRELEIGKLVPRTAAYSPDGTRLGVVAHTSGKFDERFVLVVEVDSGRRLSKTEVPGAQGIAFRDRDRLLVASGKLEVMDASSGKVVGRLDPGVAERHSIYDVEVSPDGLRAISDLAVAEKSKNAGSPHFALLWNLETGKLISRVERHVVKGMSSCCDVPLAFSPDGKLAATAFGSPRSGVKVVDVETGRVRASFDLQSNGIAFTGDGQRVVGLYRKPEYRDVATGAAHRPAFARLRPVRSARLSPDGARAFVVHERTITSWSIRDLRLEWSRELEGKQRDSLRGLSLSADQRSLAAIVGESVELVDAKTGERRHRWTLSPAEPRRTMFRANELWIFGDGPFGRMARGYSLETGEPIAGVDGKKLEPPRARHRGDRFQVTDPTTGTVSHYPIKKSKKGLSMPFATPTVLASGKLLAALGHRLFLFDLRSKKLLAKHTEKSLGVSMNDIFSTAASPDGKRIAIGTLDGSIKLLDGSTLKVQHETESSSVVTQTLSFDDEGKLLLAAGSDGVARVYRVRSHERISLVSDGREWVIYSDDGYFTASRDGGRLLIASHGLRGYRVDQLAAQRNRPDLLFERLGFGPPERVAHFEAQYQKRLRRLGVSETALGQALESAPTVRFVSLEQKGKLAELEIEAAAAAGLKSYNVFVNDVPLFAREGKPLTGSKKRARESIELGAGINKIEVSVTDGAGIESFRPFRVLEHGKKPVTDLYFLGFGVSRYANEKYNLAYPHKDVLDLADVLRQAKAHFGQVHVKTLIDQEVTATAIANAKPWLAQAKVDDTVVLFVAGHGVHTRDASADYYYVTHDTRIDRLRQTGASFELIESLLVGIGPRNKLFLLDTCESGERDPEEEERLVVAPGSRGLRARTTRALVLEQPATPAAAGKKPEQRSFLFEDERYIDNDLRRRSGAIVLSSSRGSELSWEKDEIKNGVFTEALLDALTGPGADDDADGLVSSDELRRFVTETVSKATGNAQHPTVDRDNLTANIQLPVVASARSILNRADVGTKAPEPSPAAQSPAPPPARTPHGCGCRAAPANIAGSSLLTLLALAGLIRRRRHRSRA